MEEFKIEILPADEPKITELGWTVNETAGQLWTCFFGTMVTWDKYKRLVDAQGFLLSSENADRLKDEHGNYKLSKDFPMENE